MVNTSPKLSICIPTFDRLHCLSSCLESIYNSKQNSNIDFEVCISDNNPSGNAQKIVQKYKKKITINYKKNLSNLGIGRNIVESVSMAKGEFVWILGNDDMLLPYTFNKLESLLDNNVIDYYYINSINLESSSVNLFDRPVDTNNLPNNLENFSKFKNNFEGNFFDLINPNISFDFMLGIFLSIFRRRKWEDSKHVLDLNKLNDKNQYSFLDNTCPHVMVFAKAFHNSKVWFQAEPLSINMIGEREWGNLYPLVDSIRIPEVIDEYHKYGLPLLQYLKNKNFALKRFIPNLLLMIFTKKYIGLKYLSFSKNILSNILFPNVYIFPFYYLLKKIKSRFM